MSNNQIQSGDEITLPGIRKIIKQFFYFLFWIGTFLLLAVKRNKVLLLAGLLIGLVLGYLYYISRPVFYRATMIVQNNELPKRTYAEMIKQLNALTPGGPNSKLAAALNTSPEIAGNILFVECRDMNDDPLVLDTSSKLRQQFKIIAGLSEVKELDTLQNSLLYYLNNGPYLKTLREEQTKLYNQRVNFIDSELQKLDSLKSEYNRFIATSKISATFYNNAFNPADIYVQSNNLFNQREAALKWLYIDKDAVSLIDGIKSRNSPHSITLFKALLVLGGAGFLIAFLVAFLREAKRRLA